MKDKLTLSIERTLILRAKRFSKTTRKSISKIVEDHLEELTQRKKTRANKKELHPLLKKLAGVIPGKKDMNIKEEYHKHLEEKYGNKK